MAVSTMTKVVVAGSSSELNAFMRELQHAAVFHVTALMRKDEASAEYPRMVDSGMFSTGDYTGLLELKEFLDQFREKEGLWVKLFSPLRMIKRERFYASVDSFDPGELIRKAAELKRGIELLNEEKKKLAEINSRLLQWKDIPVQLADAGESGESFITAGIAATDKAAMIREAPGIDCQVLKQGEKKSALLLACHRSERESLDLLMQGIGFEKLDVSILKGSPQDSYRSNMSRLNSIDEELEEIHSEGVKLLEWYDDLVLSVEHLGNVERLSRAFRYWASTPYSFFAAGWVMERDVGRFRAVCEMFDAVEFDIVAPGKDETPPVALENRALFAPFQLLTKLYSYPAYGTYDPSAVTSIFFAVFFAICMTDAAYGLILALLASWGLKKNGWKSDILWIAFWGGIFTIAAGLLTGGFFGDLFRRDNPFIHVQALHSFREYFIWFDPMIEPMVFFRLVLLLGVIHVITGLVIGALSGMKQGRALDALFDNITWLVIVTSLLLLLFASDLSVRMALVTSREPLLGSVVIVPAAVASGAAGVTVILFGGRDEQSLFLRFFIGFLKLIVLSGVFSYIGDILSYIRLMALGMVTSGIATAINTMAFIMIDIPVAGVLLTVIVLAAGHTFNMAIGILGGFVHTLRLQYVEFYSKFFTGGGVPFEPLSLNDRYVKIIY